MGWRLEALRQLASYAAAAVLAFALPLHLLEHAPPPLRQPPRPWTLWLILVAAAVHGSHGLRMVLYDYVTSNHGRRLVDAASTLLFLAAAAAGAYGLAKTMPPW